MARNKERLPIVYQYFIDNEKEFYKFFDMAADKKVFQLFKQNFAELLYTNIQNPDIRFGQHLINNKIVIDGPAYSKEDDVYLINNKLVDPAYILFWGSYGVNGNSDYEKWSDNKPVINAPISSIEKILGGYDGLKNYEVYAKRYISWLNSKPSPTYSLLGNLETEHIKNILISETQISDLYRKTLQGILVERGQTPILKIAGVGSVEC